MSTRRPSTAPSARKARNAVPAATGRVLACSASIPSGSLPRFNVGTALCLVYEQLFTESAATPMSASSGWGFGSGTSVSLTPDAVPESIRYARIFLLLDRAQPCLIAHTDTGGLCARCGGVEILLVLPEEAVKSRV